MGIKRFGIAAMISLLATMGHAQATCDQVTASFAENWFPVSYYASSNTPDGFAIRVHQKIMNKLGVPIKFVGNIPWKRQLSALEKNAIDAITAINFTPERNQKYVLTDSFYSFTARAFGRVDDEEKKLTTVQDLDKYRVAYSRGASFGKKFDELARLNPAFVPINGTHNIIELLVGRRVDFIILPEQLGNHLLEQSGYSEIITTVGPIIYQQNVHMAFSRKSPCATLIDAYNRELNELKRKGFISSLHKTSWPTS